MRRSTRARKREHEGPNDDEVAAEDPCAPPAKAAAIKRMKRAVEDTRASPSPSSSPDDFDDAHRDEDHGHDGASRGPSGTPEWVFSIFSEQKRAQWDEFLRTKCLARVGADFYDLFELAIAISEDEPLDAFIDTLGIKLCGPFDLLALAVCEKKQDVSLDKPLFLHGRFFLDPPEVTTVLKDASNGVNGAHWGYFRDAPEQTPEYIVFAKDSSKCLLQIAGSSLFHVLDFSIQEQLIKSPNDQGLKGLATNVKQYLRFRKLPSRMTPANLSRKRASQATAASLHKLGIVVPYNTKKQTGFRELPVVGDQLAALLQDVQEGNAKARKALSGLITRATIANDECDFGTSLLLGLDLFTTGEALEKESLQLLRVAYMLLRRLDFYKIVSAQTTHRRAASISPSSSDHNPPHILTSIVTAASDGDAQRSSNLGGSTQHSLFGSTVHSCISTNSSIRNPPETMASSAAAAAHASATAASTIAPMERSFWYKEALTEDLYLSTTLKKVTFEAQSEFQTMQIIETHSFGKTLVLDGKTQSAKTDEAVYHESLVHPALIAHPNPKTVYIGGGGEFATAREVLKHKSVEKVVMVDIDEMVCNLCRKEMPEWADGAFEDPRLEVHYTDAHAFLKQYDGTFDVIIMDIADPIEAGPGYVLYTEEFYKFAVTKLNKDGYFVTQSGPGALYNWDECFSAIYSTLKTAFNTVLPYTIDIPSFGCVWAFTMATNHDDGEKQVNAIRSRAIEETDAIVAARIPKPLKFYDGISHLGLFGVPKPIRDSLESEKRVITVDNPVFMY